VLYIFLQTCYFQAAFSVAKNHACCVSEGDESPAEALAKADGYGVIAHDTDFKPLSASFCKI
jgi:hypothetical protein